MDAALAGRVLQRLARAVEHQARADAPRQRGHLVEEAQRHAGWEAAAEHHVAGQRIERGDGVEAGLLLGRGQFRAGQDEAVLQPRVTLVDGEALAGVAGYRHPHLLHP
ncbi:hypothetical protein D3C78_584210 [compost metagenome]